MVAAAAMHTLQVLGCRHATRDARADECLQSIHQPINRVVTRLSSKSLQLYRRYTLNHQRWAPSSGVVQATVCLRRLIKARKTAPLLLLQQRTARHSPLSSF
jgi:hypothetical protein